MKILFFVVILSFIPLSAHCAGFIVDHTSTDLSQISDQWITKAKSDLHIVYEHTSHGSQIITGLNGIEQFPAFGDTYAWSNTSTGDGNSLSLKDHDSLSPNDLSQGDRDDNNNDIADWADSTASFLEDQSHLQVNVILWSWCNIAGHDIPRYLRSMEWLIEQFSEGGTAARAGEHPVRFVFITGHANGGGENDSSDSQNRLIREHCRNHDRILFDFSDIENYDPDGNYYLDKRVTDALYYDKNGNHNANWASEYLAGHPDSELYRLTKGDGSYGGMGSCAHSNGPDNDARLNCTLKGRAAWYLFARLAGWNPDSSGGTNNGDTGGNILPHVSMSPISMLLLK